MTSWPIAAEGAAGVAARAAPRALTLTPILVAAQRLHICNYCAVEEEGDAPLEGGALALVANDGLVLVEVR